MQEENVFIRYFSSASIKARLGRGISQLIASLGLLGGAMPQGADQWGGVVLAFLSALVTGPDSEQPDPGAIQRNFSFSSWKTRIFRALAAVSAAGAILGGRLPEHPSEWAGIAFAFVTAIFTGGPEETQT